MGLTDYLKAWADYPITLFERMDEHREDPIEYAKDVTQLLAYPVVEGLVLVSSVYYFTHDPEAVLSSIRIAIGVKAIQIGVSFIRDMRRMFRRPSPIEQIIEKTIESIREDGEKTREAIRSL